MKYGFAMIAKLTFFPEFEKRIMLALMMAINLHYAHVKFPLEQTGKYGPVS